MNILGAYFLLKHTKFKVKNKGTNPWRGSEKIYISEYVDDYTVLNAYCPLIYHLQSFHNISVPSINEKNKDTKKFIEVNNLDPQLIGDQYHLKSKIIISHEPTKLNYWHVELKLFNALNQEVTKKSNNWWAKSSTSYILEHLLSVPLIDLPQIEKIERHFYINE